MRLVPRTALFVPGDRPERVAKALASGADAVIVDLEDAVAESAKTNARRCTVESLNADLPKAASGGCAVLVRVNGCATEHVEADVDALVPVLGHLDAVVLPMAETAQDVRHLEALLVAAEARAGVDRRTRIVPTAETAAGVLAARELAAASPRVLTLLFGSADLSRQLAVRPTAAGTELNTARSMVVLGAAAAGVPPPWDGPYLRLDDPEGLELSARVARDLGFGGKAAIHPRQLDALARMFTPGPEEVDWARRVDEAFTAAEAEGRSSLRLEDGTFVDYPVAHRARAVLAAVRNPEGTP